jgi:hypothetical protein
MPNYCDCYLKVGPTPEAARPFLEKLDKGGFGAFVPVPVGMERDCRWLKENWGDKYDVHDCYALFDYERGKVHFVTAWGPPSKWFEAAAKQFPSLVLEMHYEESGDDLWGWLRSQGGVLTVASEKPLVDEEDDLDLEDSLMFFRASDWYHDEDIQQPSFPQRYTICPGESTLPNGSSQAAN